MLRKILFTLVFTLLTASAAHSEELTPVDLKGGGVITVEEARALLDRKAAVFYDVRNALNFGRGHISSASSVPFGVKGEEKKFLLKLPRDKEAKIVFYSHGPSGWKSYRAAAAAIEGGYGNVMWLRDGFDEWSGKGNPVSFGAQKDSETR